jgi:hypothetical protein
MPAATDPATSDQIRAVLKFVGAPLRDLVENVEDRGQEDAAEPDDERDRELAGERAGERLLTCVSFR